MAGGVEIANAWITVKPSLKGFTEEIRKELGGLDTESSRQGEKAGKSFFSKFAGAMSFGAIAGGAATLTNSVLGSFGSIVSGAAEASDATDKFKSTLEFAGLDTSKIDEVTKKVQDYADRTVYGLGDIQNMTAQLASNGVDNYEQLAEAAGNLNAISGGNAETFKSVGMVMSQTAGAGKLTTENWNQLSDAIPGAAGKLQKALQDSGAYTGNFRDAMADGQITAEEFNKAVMQIGTEPVAVEAAKSTETFEGMVGNLQASIEGGLAKAFKELKPYIGTAFDGLSKASDTILPMFVDGVKNAVKFSQDFTNWIKQNQGTLSVVGGLLGGLALGMAAYNVQAKISAAGGIVGMFKQLAGAIKGTAAMQFILNGAMWASPITWIVGGIAAAGLALWAFFTKTETGKKLWDELVAKFKTGIEWIKNAFTGLKDLFLKGDFTGALTKAFGWEEDSPIVDKLLTIRDKVIEVFNVVKNALKVAFDWIKTSATWLWQSVLVPVFHGISAAVSWMADAVKWSWENVIKPAWDALAVAGKWLAGLLMAFVFIPIQTAWSVMSAVFKWAWENLIKPAWDAIAAGATWLWQNVLVPAFDGIKIAFQAVGDFFSWVWTALIQPAWALVEAGAVWLWQNVLAPAFDAIKAAFQAVGDFFNWVWVALIQPAWAAVEAGITWLWQNVLSPIFGYMIAGFQAVGDFFMWVWTALIQPAWAAVEAGANWMWLNVLVPAFEGIKSAFQAVGDFFSWVWNSIIKPAWDDLGNGVSWVIDNIVKPAFERAQQGLDTLKGWFQTAVDGIRTIWDGLTAATAKPIRFVIEKVINGGIFAGWNKVANLVNLPTVDDIPLGDLGQYATGGVLPGYTPGRDVHRFFSPTGGSIDLSGGEAIMRPEWVRAVGGANAVNAMNLAARSGGITGVRKMLGEGAAYADGGIIGDRIARTMAALRPEHGKPYQYAGVGNPSWDCSGLWSGAVQELNTPGTLRNGRIFNTESTFENFGFAPGLSGRVTIGVLSGAGGGENGHMAGTIDGVNVESSGSHGVQIGGAARGSDHSMFNHTYTLVDFPGEFISGGNGGGGGISLGGIIKSLWDKAVNAIPSFDGAGEFAKVPAAFAKKAAESVWDFIKSKIPAGSSDGAYHGEVGAGVEQWRGLVQKILTEKGFSTDLTDTVLRRMDQESSGNPAAINGWDSNAAAGTPSKGLMQVIDPTFQSYKDPGYDDIWDPESNIRASMNYAVAAYGSLPAAYNKAGGYALGGILPTLFDTGGVWNPGTVGVNLSGASEYVFTNASMRDFMKSTELLRGAADEISVAFDGGDFGYMSLAKMLGNEQAARSLLDAIAAIGKYMPEVNTALQDFGKTASKDALDMFGLGGLVDVGQSLWDTGNEWWGLYQQGLNPAPASTDTAASIASTAVATAIPDVPAAPAVEATPNETVSINIADGQAYTSDQVEQLIKELDGKISKVDIKVEKLANKPADVTASVAMMV